MNNPTTISPISIAICVPTIGRDTLWDTLESIAKQLGVADSVTIMPDLANSTLEGVDNARAAFQFFSDKTRDTRWNYDAMYYPARSWGHCQRNRHIRLTNPGKWICSIDDDDAYTPTAFRAFRTAAVVYGAVPLIFRMRMPEGHLIWKDNYRGDMILGNYGTPCFLVPRVRGHDKNPVYGLEYAGDHSYIHEAARMIGDPQFVNEVVANINPKGVKDGN
jgi:hypothetical protein